MEQVRKIVREDGTVVLSLRGGWTAQAISAIEAGGFDELSVNTGEWKNFEPLMPFVNQVRRLSVTSPVTSFRGIEKLTKLVSLELDDAPNPPLDILQLRQLECCYLRWHKKYPKAFFELPRLREITLVGYSDSNCENIGLATGLVELDLRQGAVKSLSGLERLGKMRSLSLAYMKNLQDVSAVAGLTEMEVLHIEKCPKVMDIAFVEQFNDLRVLFLDCGSSGFQDLRWLSKFTKLVELLIAVPVQSPDWSVVFAVPKLRDVVINTRPGYKLKDDELIAKATSIGRELTNLVRAGKKDCPAFKFRMSPRKLH